MNTSSRTTIEIVTIGNELLYGLTPDTNARWLSLILSEEGFNVIHKTTVGDNRDHIIQALSDAAQRADVILTTGGLGPTSDDLTKACMATFFGCESALHEEALNDIKRLFKHQKRALTEADHRQAYLPIGCIKITNTLGSAPGMWFEKDNKIFVAMPGVPSEMKKMAQSAIVPRLTSLFNRHIIRHYTIRTVGIGESSLAERISPWENSLPKHIQLAYLPNLGEVMLRLTGMGNSPDKIKAELTAWSDKLIPWIGEYIYGYEDDSLASAIGNKLRQQGLKIAVAESCTGGFLSHRITSIPGSSAYYSGGMVAYDNAIKISRLEIPAAMLEKEGAVSRPVVMAMARSVRRLFNTNIGVATSGIAGPEGGTPKKPVGTTWFALCDGTETIAKQYTLGIERSTNIHRASTIALNMIRKKLRGILVER